MALSAIITIVKSISTFATMDLQKKHNHRKFQSVQERIQYLREKLSQEGSNINCTSTKLTKNVGACEVKKLSPMKTRQSTRGRELALAKTEENKGKNCKRKLSASSPKKEENNAKKKIDGGIIKSPRKSEIRTRGHIAERMKKIREKLTTTIENEKTDLTLKDNVTSETVAGPSQPFSQRKPTRFKIPKNVPKPKEGPSIESERQTLTSISFDNYDVEAMDTDNSCGKNSCEEMDWEINEVRRELRDPILTPNNGHSTNSNDSFNTLTDGGDWILVIDTNVFISDLLFVQSIRDTDVPGLGYPVIYVPHRVLCELDALKDKLQLKNETVARSARKAVTYLNSCLTDKHPRIKGQSISTYIAMKDLVTEDADDKILLSCLQLKKSQPDKLLVFLSNDINLRNKAIIEDIETFSVLKFQSVFMSHHEEDPAKMNKTRLESRIKTIVKLVLTEIFEAEVNTKTNNSNQLMDILDNFIKKWGSCFGKFLPVPAEEQLQKLRMLLQLEETAGTCQFVSLIDTSKTFMTHFYVKGKVYFKSVEKAFKVLGNLRTRALDFENDTEEEKFSSGALEEILRLSWEKAYTECQAINSAKERGDASIVIREQNFIITLKHLIDAFAKVMSTSLFDMPTSSAVNDLATILASCTKDDIDHVRNLLISVCTTIDGRNIVENAYKVFQGAYNNCILTS